MPEEFHQNERNVNEKFKFSDGGLKHPYIKTQDISQGSNQRTIENETVVFAVGDAGTTGVAALESSPIMDSTGALIGNKDSSSFSWISNAILTTEVAWNYEQTDIIQLAALNNGEFAIDYLTGKLRYKKATAGVTDVCDYSTRELSTEITTTLSGLGDTVMEGNFSTQGVGDSISHGLLGQILKQLKKMNTHLEVLSDMQIKDADIE